MLETGIQGDWYPSQNFRPGEAKCWVFLRNWVTYRDHLPLNIFGGWHLSISPILDDLMLITKSIPVGLQWCWWQRYDCDNIKMLVIKPLCWWLLSLFLGRFQCKKSDHQHLKVVTNTYSLQRLHRCWCHQM